MTGCGTLKSPTEPAPQDTPTMGDTGGGDTGGTGDTGDTGDGGDGTDDGGTGDGGTGDDGTGGDGTGDTPTFALRIEKLGAGTGRVTSDPAGIDCGDVCRATYDEKTDVVLTATPDPGSVFAGWSGTADCRDGMVRMTAGRVCEATFDLDQTGGEPPPPPTPTFTLTIKKIGTGTGVVTSQPAGIDCGRDCDETYDEGTQVTLTPTADAGSSFVTWTGNSDCRNGSVTMTSDITCTATFDSNAFTFTQIQNMFFSPTCAVSGCHDTATAQAGLVLEAGVAYNNIVNVSSTERPSLLRVEPGNSDQSYLAKKLRGDNDISGERMPFGGPFLSAAEIEGIEEWILAGAPNN